MPIAWIFVASMYARSGGSSSVASFFNSFDAHFLSAYSQIYGDR
jgi:hypothetical protein